MKTNYVAMIVCGVANALLGMGWYGIFGKTWMEGNGLTEESVQGMNMGATYGASFAVAIVSAFILNWLFQRMNVSGWMDGLKTGGAIGLFGLLGTIIGNMYAMRPMSLSVIDGCFVVLQFAAFGAILAGWPKRA